MANELRDRFDSIFDLCEKVGLPTPVLKPGRLSGWEIDIPDVRRFIARYEQDCMSDARLWLEGYRAGLARMKAASSPPSNEELAS